MKKNHKKKAVIGLFIITFVLLIVLSILAANRYFYGSFNVFSNPIRIVHSGMHYNHRSFRTFSDEEKPRIEISGFFDIITGKKIFSTNKDFVGPGKTIYLHLGGNKYISYSSGGGG